VFVSIFSNKNMLKLILILNIIFGFFINTFFRPYIYSNNINDFGIAGMGNNFLFIPSVYIMLYLFKIKFIFDKYKDVIFHFFILSLVEVLSYFFKGIGTFDFKDILALFFGAILTYFIAKKLIV
jgi:uncharacterized protein YneF (UPF0154 family)